MCFDACTLLRKQQYINCKFKFKYSIINCLLIVILNLIKKMTMLGGLFIAFFKQMYQYYKFSYSNNN